MRKGETTGPWIIGMLFLMAGSLHFLRPEPYMAMMPPWLPAPAAMVAISGIAEMAGGLGLLVPRLRRWAAWGLILLLVGVFPANFHVARNGWPGTEIPAWVLWARLPFQAVFIWAVYRFGGLGRAESDDDPKVIATE